MTRRFPGSHLVLGNLPATVAQGATICTWQNTRAEVSPGGNGYRKIGAAFAACGDADADLILVICRVTGHVRAQ